MQIFFSKRELRWLKFFAMFQRHLVPWSSIDIHGKFYGDHPKGTPASEEGWEEGGGFKRKRGRQM